MVAAAVLWFNLTAAVAPTYNHGQSILNDRIRVFAIPAEMRYIPFKDEYVGRYGFVRNISNLGVIVPPTYEDIYNSTYMLVPVKKNGKWGVIDIGARYVNYSLCEPIIPCRYSKIKIKTNNIAICDGVEIDISKQGYEKWE